MEIKKSRIKDIATSFTTLIFLVIAISGIMMFFHFNDMLVKELHEILGLVFVSTAILHVVMNWKNMKSYFSKKIFVSAIVIVSIVSGVFVYQSFDKGENPKKVLIQKVLNAPLNDSLKLLNGNYEVAIKKLELQNIEVLDNKNIRAIAKANKTSPFRIVSIITSK